MTRCCAPRGRATRHESRRAAPARRRADGEGHESAVASGGPRRCLAQRQPKLDIGRLLAERKWLLVSLAPGTLGRTGRAPAGGHPDLRAYGRRSRPRPLCPRSGVVRSSSTSTSCSRSSDLPFGIEYLFERARGLSCGVTVATQALGRLAGADPAFAARQCRLTGDVPRWLRRGHAAGARAARSRCRPTCRRCGASRWQLASVPALARAWRSSPAPPCRPRHDRAGRPIRRRSAERYGGDPAALEDELRAHERGHETTRRCRRGRGRSKAEAVMSRNVGRNLASSAPSENRRAGGGSRQIRAADDSASARRSVLVSPPASSTPSPLRLTDHDQAVVLLLSELRLATGFQIARRLFGAKVPSDSGAWAARRALRRLEQWRIIDRLPAGRRRPWWQYLAGVRARPGRRRLLARLGYETKRMGTPGDRHVAHTLAITELAVRLHEAMLTGDLDLIELQTGAGLLARLPRPDGRAARVQARPVRSASGPARLRTAGSSRWTSRPKPAARSSPRPSATCALPQRQRAARPRRLPPGVVDGAEPQARRADRRTHCGAALRPREQLFVVWPYDEVIGRLDAEAKQ